MVIYCSILFFLVEGRIEKKWMVHWTLNQNVREGVPLRKISHKDRLYITVVFRHQLLYAWYYASLLMNVSVQRTDRATVQLM
jgi:hypothetical protein